MIRKISLFFFVLLGLLSFPKMQNENLFSAIPTEDNLEKKNENILAKLDFFKTEEENKKINFRLRAKAVVAIDLDEKKILFEKNPDEPLPIASITKLLTAMVFLEQKPDLDDAITISKEDRSNSGKTRLRIGETLSLRDLLHASLMCSDNCATKALVRSTGMAVEDFVELMNQKAKEWGLEKSFFVEVTGLSAENVSTALECAKLVFYALQDSLISHITKQTQYEFYSHNRKIRRHQIGNSNRLLKSKLNILVGKTGFIQASGYCIATIAEDGNKKKFSAVVLGAPTNNSRFQQARNLFKWIFSNGNSKS
jgi:D-alanyl-D-alanine endopeptidase (penicillin-binding protein 7)